MNDIIWLPVALGLVIVCAVIGVQIYDWYAARHKRIL